MLNAKSHRAFWLSEKLPIGKCFSKTIEATMMKMENFVLTFTTSNYQLPIGASIIAVKDSQ